MRKNVLKYDDVMNKQRTVIYEQRRRVLEGEDLSEEVQGWIDEVIERVVAAYTEADYPEEWDLDALCKAMEDVYASDDPITADELREEVGLDRAALVEEFQEDARDAYAEKERSLGMNPETEQPLLRDVERFLILQVVDTRWREHLENMDYLREGVHLRAMAQKDPLVEYTTEGEAMFRELGLAIREEVVTTLFHAQIEVSEVDQLQQAQEAQGFDGGGVAYEHESLAGADAIAAAGGARGQRRLGHGGRAGGGRRRRRDAARHAGAQTRSAATTRAGAAAARSTSAATARNRMTDQTPSKPLDQQLQEIGAQLAWVRDYL